jgi:hypothetical protein
MLKGLSKDCYEFWGYDSMWLEAFEIIQFSVKMTLEKFGSEFVL